MLIKELFKDFPKTSKSFFFNYCADNEELKVFLFTQESVVQCI